MLPIYRGRRQDGSWVSGCLIYDPETMQVLGIISNDPNVHPLDMPYMCDGCVDGHFPTVDPKTVGMCTGLKDRNGRRIFEGDVVAFDGGHFIVEYFAARMGFGFSGLKGRGVVSGFTMMEWEHLEVIGNIHDNPALLEG